MPKPKKPRRRKDTLLYMSALQMMEGLSLIEEQGEYLELTENDHAFLADLLQKAEEAGKDGVVGVSKTVADRYDRVCGLGFWLHWFCLGREQCKTMRLLPPLVTTSPHVCQGGT